MDRGSIEGKAEREREGEHSYLERREQKAAGKRDGRKEREREGGWVRVRGWGEGRVWVVI